MLDKLLGRNPEGVIKSDRIYLRAPELRDWKDWAEVRETSRQHLVPWEPVWAPDSLTQSGFRGRLRRYAADARAGVGHAFFLFRNSDDKILGSITISNIRRGVAQTGTMGYWTGLPYVRQGYMYEGIVTLLPYLFDELSLRRVEAACILENVPSASLLEKAGFTREGYAREYLCINGVWQDHLLFAILKGDPIGVRQVPTDVSGMSRIGGE